MALIKSVQHYVSPSHGVLGAPASCPQPFLWQGDGLFPYDLQEDWPADIGNKNAAATFPRPLFRPCYPWRIVRGAHPQTVGAQQAYWNTCCRVSLPDLVMMSPPSSCKRLYMGSQPAVDPNGRPTCAH